MTSQPDGEDFINVPGELQLLSPTEQKEAEEVIVYSHGINKWLHRTPGDKSNQNRCVNLFCFWSLFLKAAMWATTCSVGVSTSDSK